jgi:putative acetyltransferase
LSEAEVIEALRRDGALALSLVGELDGQVIAHIAFSPMRIGRDGRDWYQLGPVAVIPERQRAGHGSALIREGLRRLQLMGAAGCVLLGYPPYYARFGFELDPALTYGGNPNPALQRLVFSGPPPRGEIALHSAFAEG